MCSFAFLKKKLTMTAERKSLIIWSSFLFLTLAWGSSFILVKRGLQGGFSPFDIASVRMLSAFVCLVIPAVINFKHIPKDKLWYVVISALLSMFIPAYLFSIAQTRMESSMVSILNALTPAFTFGVGILAFRQPLKKMQSLGLFVGFLGSLILIMVNSKGGFSVNEYAFLVLAATFCYGTNVNLVKYKLSEIKSIHISTVTVAIAGISAMIYLLFSGSVPSIYANALVHPWSFGAMVLLGAMGTAMAQIVFNNMLTLTTSVLASSITYFIPIVAVLWGVWDGEILVAWHYLGMVFIIGGVLILNKNK
jgi:drug/metabolite transporter (DMT)-like permease